MDPLSAVGIASAVVGFLQLGTQIAKRLDELSKVGDVPAVFRDIRTNLPLLLSVVAELQESHQRLTPEAERSFENSIEECYRQIERVQEILERVTVAESDSKLKKGFKALVSLRDESRVVKVATALRDNITFLRIFGIISTERSEKNGARRLSSSTVVSRNPPPSYASSAARFIVPFDRDPQFIGREDALRQADEMLSKQNRVAITGAGGVGKSQVAIEYAYRFSSKNPDSHVFWIYGGSEPRFYEGYKKIAQGLALPSWDDPDVDTKELVSNYLNSTSTPYLLILDNADDMKYWWPAKYTSAQSNGEETVNLSKYLPDKQACGTVLVTSRDRRIASRLANSTKPVTLHPMDVSEAKRLLRAELEDCEESDVEEDILTNLVQALDCIPLAITQAAAFVKDTCRPLSEYLEALENGDQAKEFLHEELNDARRDESSVNSAFRTWIISFDQISKQKPRAADLLCLLGMLDRQSIPRWLVKTQPEFVTSSAALQALSLVFCPDGSEHLQLHRLCQLFIKFALENSRGLQKWRDLALKCVAQAYPTEIGTEQWPVCDALAPHVATLLTYDYCSEDARLDLAHLLCWAADFDIERGMYAQALTRARQSHDLYEMLLPPNDPRLASAKWLCGRLTYYEARSQSDVHLAQETLEAALSIADPKTLVYSESAFELAYIFFGLDNEEECLRMGNKCVECWTSVEGPNGVRTLDERHDYSLELAMFGRVEEAVHNWQDILRRCSQSNASDNTKLIFKWRSLASIAEFEGKHAAAEPLYAKLVQLGNSIYGPQHVHVLDYRLSHAEQILHQGRHEEVRELCEAILETCKNKSEWRIAANCYEMMAQCCFKAQNRKEEEVWRLKGAELYLSHPEGSVKEAIEAVSDAARCLLANSKPKQADQMFRRVLSLQEAATGPQSARTTEILEHIGICKLGLEEDAEAEQLFAQAETAGKASLTTAAKARVIYNRCIAYWNQNKWQELKKACREALSTTTEQDEDFKKLLEMGRAQPEGSVKAAVSSGNLPKDKKSLEKQITTRLSPKLPPDNSTIPLRFGRIIHPRTWSS